MFVKNINKLHKSLVLVLDIRRNREKKTRKNWQSMDIGSLLAVIIFNINTPKSYT